MARLKFTVPKEYDGAMAKSFLRGYCGVSSRLLARCKKEKDGIVVGNNEIRTIDRVKVGDVIILTFSDDNNLMEPEPLDVPVLWEDGHLIILNKPYGMPVHPSPGHDRGTLVNFASYYMKTKNEDYSFRPLNRLDKDTSGLVLGAKNAFCAEALKHSVSKEYLAVCEGKLTGKGKFSQPIRLKAGHTIQRETGEGGQPAVTHFKALASAKGHTLLALWLETGRTHQIRVHLSSAGFPLAGDDMYGGSRKLIQRQALHLASMRFTHPVRKTVVEAKAPVPSDFLQLLKFLGIHKPTL